MGYLAEAIFDSATWRPGRIGHPQMTWQNGMRMGVSLRAFSARRKITPGISKMTGENARARIPHISAEPNSAHFRRTKFRTFFPQIGVIVMRKNAQLRLWAKLHGGLLRVNLHVGFMGKRA